MKVYLVRYVPTGQLIGRGFGSDHPLPFAAKAPAIQKIKTLTRHNKRPITDYKVVEYDLVEVE
jgi:hypothetical protein